MPSETGWWTAEESINQHDFSYRLAHFIGEYFPKKDKLVDFGCGEGTYLRYLHDIGFENISGFEGQLPTKTDFGNIFEHDLTKSIDLNPKAENSICLEVGEHIPEEFLPTFINNLTSNTKNKILLSWGTPGQSGYRHVSCRHNIWVIKAMENRGWKLLAEDSLKARSVVEERLNYFRATLMVYEKNKLS